MLVAVLLIVAGLAALLMGGDALVLGAGRLARRFGIPPLVIGLTVVAFATSAPELAVALIAAFSGTPDIAVGNVLGSNIFNVFVAVGAVAIITPISIQPTLYKREIPLCIAATLLVLLFSTTGLEIRRWEGALLVVVLVAFLGRVIWQALSGGRVAAGAEDPFDDDVERSLSVTAVVAAPAALGLILAGEMLWAAVGLALIAPVTWVNTGLVEERPDRPMPQVAAIGLGLLLLLLGSSALVDGCKFVAGSFGISDSIIGLTVVAIGTSAPELATSLAAARQGQDDIAVGNALGSNLFNLLAVLGLTAVVTPFAVDEVFLRRDIWVALGSVIVLLPFMAMGHRIGRRAGFGLVLCWLAYTGWLVALELGRLGH